MTLFCSALASRITISALKLPEKAFQKIATLVLQSHAVEHGVCNGTCFLLQSPLERLAAFLGLNDGIERCNVAFRLCRAQAPSDDFLREAELGRFKPLLPDRVEQITNHHFIYLFKITLTLVAVDDFIPEPA